MRKRSRRWPVVAALGALGALATTAGEASAQTPAPSSKAAFDEAEATRLIGEVTQAHGFGQLGRFRACVSPAERLLAMAERSFGSSDPALLPYLDLLGACALGAAMPARAEQVFSRALAIASAAMPARPADTATALRNLGVLAQSRGDLAGAEGSLVRAAEIRRRFFGGDHPELASILRDLGSLRIEQGRYTEAEALYRELLRIREHALGAAHPETLCAAADLASLLSKAGAYVEAEQLFLQALASAEQRPSADDRVITRLLVPYVLVGYVAHLADRGRDVEALRYLERATATLEQALGVTREGEGLVMTTALAGYAAIIFGKLGDYARGRRTLARFLAAARTTFGPDHPVTATAHRALGELLLDENEDLVGAERHLRQALAIQEKALGPDHPDLGYTVSSLGELLLARGDFREAEPLFLRARALWLRALGPDHPRVAAAIHHLGEVAESAGDLGQARGLFEQALNLRARKLGPDHPVVAGSYARLALLDTAAGRPGDALRAAERAAAIRDRIAPVVLTIGSERQKRAYMATLTRESDHLVGLSAAHPDDPAMVRAGLGIVLRRKGLVLEAMADIRASLRRRLGPEEQALFDRLTLVESQLAAASLAEGAVPGRARLDEERQKLEAELSSRSAPFRAERQPVTVDAVASALPEGAALVELVRYRPYDPGHALPSSRWAQPRYGAYVLRSQGAPSFVVLGDAEPIDKAVKRLRNALDDPDLAHDPRPAAIDAHRQILAPILPLLGGARRLWVSPDGELNLLPFAALIDGATGGYLVERYTLTYLTGGRALLHERDRPPAREGPLVIAAPAYDAGGARDPKAPPQRSTRGRRSRSLLGHLPAPPLPGTRDEAEAIAALLPGARVLLDAEATEGAIKAARAPSVLHLATHGFFFEDEQADARSAENALLRSGLLLAGANALQSGDDDGVLTALEANDLDLHGTALVVLSACETGLGSATTGEGVYGLRRALSMAGAETVVMSLWRADDQATRSLMEAFYRRLGRGEGRSEAMRGAQLALLGDAATAHPHLWAPFIVSGDDRPMRVALAPAPAALRGPPGCACTAASAAEAAPSRSRLIALAVGAAAAILRRRRSARHPRHVAGHDPRTPIPSPEF